MIVSSGLNNVVLCSERRTRLLRLPRSRFLSTTFFSSAPAHRCGWTRSGIYMCFQVVGDSKRTSDVDLFHLNICYSSKLLKPFFLRFVVDVACGAALVTFFRVASQNRSIVTIGCGAAGDIHFLGSRPSTNS